MDKNIVLIGFFGTGKTSVGKLIAEKLHLNYFDIDAEVKRRCLMNIGDIFKKHGEKFFREIETEIVREYSKAKDYVIATGAGVVLDSANIDLLKENGIIFRLKGSIETIIDNLKKDSLHMKDRPLLETEHLYQRISQLMQDREQFYSKCNDYEVSIDRKSLMEVAETITSLLNHDKLTSQISFFDLCEQYPDKQLFTYIGKNTLPVSLTGRELAHKIKILGSVFQDKLASQEKVLLLFEQGLEYIYSLFSCWYANVIAIPIAVTASATPEKIAEKVNAILSDSQANGIITTTGFMESLKAEPSFSKVPVWNIDELIQENSSNKAARLFTPDDLGLLLYTSGSTSKPKGVMISHQNLMARALRGGTLWNIHQESRIVSWMPQFHSFGLDFSILTPLSKGATCIIFSPSHFLETPENWWRLIDKFQATHTGAPNFAFDYCYSTIDLAAVQDLSLRSLEAIISGGEPFRKETYQNFMEKFRSLGLTDPVFCPEFGLSEAGSLVTKKPGQPLHFLTLDIPSLEQGVIKQTKRKTKSKTITNCGEIGEGVEIRIVNPETCEPCPAAEIGEIWVRCASVTKGYFSLKPETNQTFWGTLKDSPEDGFLRTGDLGFIEENSLYIVGRQKEVIIIHGKNHHPVDIEWTIHKHLPELTLPVAVFACEIDHQEKIIVVQEIEAPLSEPEYIRLTQRIITAVSGDHELEVYEINLIEKGGVPKTGSGKVQRNACRTSYINQELPVIHRYHQEISKLASQVNKPAAIINPQMLETLKKEVFLPLLKIDYDRIKAAETISELGLNSIQYVRIAKQIEAVYKIQFSPVSLFKYRSFGDLGQYIASQIENPSSSANNPAITGTRAEEVPKTNMPVGSERDIAIIGVSCHFPGGTVDLETFWENLARQKDGITDIVESRPGIITDDQNYYGNSSNAFPRWGGFTDDVAEFDASFFNISPLEAESMDPQQRKLLELTWSVIEDSGYNPISLSGKDLGLFIGVHNNDYSELVSRNPALMDIYGGHLDSGLHMSMIAHRVSRWFNFHGPSEIVNTACSSSLVAIYHAVESIYRGDSSLAIAGGINLILTSRVYRSSENAGMLSKDGRCKTFDESADGFVRAEGYGAVLLKPYRQAVKDGDMIYGVIKKAVLNHDGKSNSLRAPNLNAQKELIKAAYQDSDLSPETISYIEAHGTGTPLGDPIEVQALQEAFREIKADLPEDFCGLGTVKTNIGHCESAAGMAGLIKVLLALKYRTLPGILHFKKLNPYIQLQGSPFYIIKETQPWKRLKDSTGQEIPLRAGISSFGFGGANAHVVVEEYIFAKQEQSPFKGTPLNPVMIVLSAKNEEQLKEQAQRLLAVIKKRQFSDFELPDMAYTLQMGREAMEERLGIVTGSFDELIRKLTAFLAGEEAIVDLYCGQAKRNQEALTIFTTDEEMQEAIQKWIERKKYGKLLDLWVKGLVFDWNRVYGENQPRRINLPTYPFAKESYWVPIGNYQFLTPRSGDQPEYLRKQNDLMYLPVWEERPLESPITQDGPNTVLIIYFERSSKIEKTIQEYYRQKKITKNVIKVKLSNQTKQVSEKEWQCDINDSNGFDACIQGYEGIDCLYFIAECQMKENPFNLDELVQSQQNNEIQLLRLIKALKQKNVFKKTINCYLITQDNYRIADTKINPYGGGITGLAYTIAQEEPQLLVRNIDISAEDLITPQKRTALLTAILTETPSNRGAAVKLQSGSRYQQEFLKLDTGRLKKGVELKKAGVYVILGGSGTLGKVITRHLMQKYHAKVVWIGRQPEMSDAIQAEMKSFNTLGELLYIRADVTSLEQMRLAVTTIKKHYPIINGAIFSGVVFQLEKFDQITENEFLDVLNVKTIGSLNFYTAFQDESLDFMCYFSSIQAFSFTEAVNSIAYAAGITFSDAFVRFICGNSKFPVGTINWGYWKATVENSLLNNIGLLEDHEATDCFEYYIDLLQEGTFHQIACLRFSESERKLLSSENHEAITVYQKGSDSIIRSLGKNKFEDPKIAALFLNNISKEFPKWMAKLLFTQMRQLGLFNQAVVAEEIVTACKKANVIDKYERWLKECLVFLEENGYVRIETQPNNRIYVRPLEDPDPADQEQIWRDWDVVKESYLQDINWETQVRLADACLRKLPEILRGKIPAAKVIFPNSSIETVMEVNRGNVLSDYFNEIVANITESYVKQRLATDPGKKIRIIEVGAKTGSTSAKVFAKLKSYVEHIEYCYTDIEKAFLIFAEDTYGPDNSYLTYKLWNIEKPLAGQEIEAGVYDIVIATNVLHATPNIRQTIRNAKTVLKTNGIIILNELIQNNIYGTLTFGLLDGWWVPKDAHLRIPGSPLLDAETWWKILTESGFRGIQFPAEAMHKAGQQVIIAESDGIVRSQILEQNDTQNTATMEQPSRRLTVVAEKAPVTTSSSTPKKRRRIEMTGLSVEQCLEWDLKGLINKILRIPRDKIDLDKNLAEFGFNSLSLNQLAIQLIKLYGISITPAMFYGYPTIEKLTGYYISKYPEIIQEFYREEPVELNSPIGTQVVSGESEPKVLGAQVVSSESEPKTIQRIQLDMRNLSSSIPEPIAIIGMSGRFPGARNIDELWEILATGQDMVQEIPPERFDWRQHYGEPSKEPGKTNCKWCGCIPGIREFDPLFFEISPREAETMDPRQRLLLQESWKALEDAGYGPNQLKAHTVGMFVGTEQGYYQFLTRGDGGLSSNNNAIVASRLAYFLNLNGPVLAIDTACSSSLVAVHQAVLSLRAGECTTAIAAGANLLIDPTPFIEMGQAGMLSDDGKCFTFDKRANGMVPGEAVAAIVLKRLSAAQADCDPIYAVIKGNGINYDGKTNGITAPSGVSQTALLKAVYDQYQVNPEDIEYIVTHGTGTKLGDPVEINALYDAFKNYTDKQGYCALTSTKTNFGHCLGASGLVSFISLVQAMQHGIIPASLNCEAENDYINWQESPFYVNKANRSWPVKGGTLTGATHRVGAVSAFGMSGTNAHMVVQSYPKEDNSVRREVFPEKVPCYLLAFSAKTQEVLEEKLKNMIELFENGKIEQNLIQVSYTLLEGRHHFNYRYAMVVQDQEHALYILKQVLSKGKMPNVFYGRVPRDFTGQKAIEQYGQELLIQSLGLRENSTKYQDAVFALADLYCQGYRLNWQLLFGENKPSRIHLPTYPFAREHYWAPEINIQGKTTASTGITTYIHPLLHQNTSNLSEQQFSSIFTGEEFFLKDHVINGQRVLPGVAYLEMARAAVEQAAGKMKAGHTGIRFKNVVWMRPVVVGAEPVKVHIGLYPEDNGEISYEIYGQPANGEEIVYSQGSLILTKDGAGPVLDLKVIQAECRQNTIAATEIYQTFKMVGIEYGPGHQGIEEVYTGPGKVLAKLALPGAVQDTGKQFVLHPSIMDAALQASIEFMIGIETGPVAAMPFALQEMEVLGDCSGVRWAVLESDKESKAGDKVQKIDIDLCDAQGKVQVRMKGFTTRVLEGEIGAEAPVTGSILLEPVWKEQAVNPEAETPEYERHLVVLCEPEGTTAEIIETAMNGVRCLILKSRVQGIDKRYQEYAVQLFETIQTLINEKLSGEVLIQVVVSRRGERQLFSGLTGLLKTAGQENLKFSGQLIEICTAEDWTGLVTILSENRVQPLDRQIRYQDGKRMVAGLSEVKAAETGVTIWKDGGVYLITGGAGSLGLIFAKEIAHQAKGTTLILTGRSALSGEKQAKLKELESLGTRVEYQAVDVTDKKTVTGLIQGIQAEYGGLQGIIHCAGIIRDSYIIKKTREDLLEVMGPKVSGLVNLDQASKDLPLDFIILFSSTSVMVNLGQTDYATGNAFMDAYAVYRNELAVSGERRGKTLAMNWPLWKEGGTHIDETIEQMMQQNAGIIPMLTGTGLRALYQGMATGKPQVMVMEGNLNRIKARLLSNAAPVTQPVKAATTAPVAVGIDTGSLFEKIQGVLKQAVSKLMKFKLEDIDIDIELNEFGFDSISLTQFTNTLNQEYQMELMPTIVFEYPTLRGFAQYLGNQHQGVFAEFAKPIKLAQQEITTQEIAEEIPVAVRRRSRFYGTIAKSTVTGEIVPDAIAIVGMSGRFPQARNVAEFWKNLIGEKDCITEIPKERWDWEVYYGDPDNETNKTNIKWGGFINGVGEFDPLFFGISPREAELMDPNQRLLMTCTWEAIEDAGISAESLSGTKTGIFIGTISSDYRGLLARANVPIEGYSSTGAVASVGPNRMSYFLNIHGPSELIDTACSSALVAIHRAVSVIESGSCEMAIAGGINTILTPEDYISFNKAGMLCEDGRCKTFSNEANGYVRGEGAGVIFLKKLKDAEAAGDHIYGIIRGTAENHGGRANSLTAPNPKAQAELLKAAYTKAGFDPRTVTYIEAHGTGTKLGDPIEINGLKTAFKELYLLKGEKEVKSSHCGLGSVKTNIGHLEMAAGVAGVIKVLLQLKYKTLVKSLHCAAINPYIQLSGSPFYIVQETKPWEVLQTPEGNEIPRRAGVSSFGFGGANAHVVIEEYIPKKQWPQISVIPQQPVVIILSAKNEERLRERAIQLLAFIREQQLADNELADMAYTLQVGRDAMEERVGLLAGSIKELEEKLKGFVEGLDDSGELYYGQVKRNKEALGIFTVDEDLQKAIDSWIIKGKYAKLLDLWVKGLVFDWKRLYGELKPRRISLPVYPFAQDWYWVPKGKTQSGKLNLVIEAAIHPLLQRNTSDLTEQRYSSTFTGREFFLADHVVKGQRVLPGVAYLEMARAAVEFALGFGAAGILADRQTRIRLKNVVWVRPIVLGDHPIQVHIGLFPAENGEVAFEIYCLPDESNAAAELILHSQGSASVIPITSPPTLDLQAIQVQCTQNNFSAAEIYEVFKKMGIDYGPAHRGIDAIYVGKEKVLAKLALPVSVSATLDQFILHPSIMDSALQASISLMMNSSAQTTSGPSLPFALQELEVYGKCDSTMWALIRYSETSGSTMIATESAPVLKIDIDLCDVQGMVRVRIKGFTTRALKEAVKPGPELNVISESSAEPLVGKIMLTPVWDVIQAEKGQTLPSPTDRVVIIGGTKNTQPAIQQCYPQAQVVAIQSMDTIDTIARKLEAQGLIDHIIWIAPHQTLKSLANDTLIKEQNRGVLQVFRLIKALLQLGYGTKNLGWTLITIRTQPVQKDEAINPVHASLYGLIGSLAKEYTNWKLRLIDLGNNDPWPLTDLFSLLPDPKGDPFLYRNGEWYRQKLIVMHGPDSSKDKTVYRTGGVYVVIGGAGGIGEAWSEYLIRTYQAQVVWIGRREKDATIQAKLDRLAILGPVPQYISADATDQKSLQEAYETIKARYPRIHGVIHSAIVLLDRSLKNMDEDRFRTSLAAKVDVSVRIAQVFQKEDLDFVLFFSSMESFIKAPGQSNYASGCTFKDAFAHQLALEWPCTVKIMNWGYWGSMGIVASKPYQERMAQAGVGSIEPPESMEALEILLAGTIDQIALLKTTKPLTMEEADIEELVTVYPPFLSSHMEDIKHLDSITAKFTKTLAASGAMTAPIETFEKSETSSPALEIEALLGRLLWGQLQSLGLFTERNWQITALKTKLGWRDIYIKWLDESIAFLTRQNYLQYDGTSYTVIGPQPSDIDAAWNEWEQKRERWLEDPNLKARVVLVEATVRALPGILTGNVPATDIMFPNSSMELVAGMYKNNPVVDTFNEILAEMVAAYIEARLKQDSSARIRIIEIGAGTGGTSIMVFPKLKLYQANIQEYCYTDISRAFLIHAEEEYGPGNPYLTYQIFNVEKPLTGQGIQEGGYDLAIATNVLHATKNIRQTIRNAKATLKNNGLLLLHEICNNFLFTHLTFGLLEGWWLYEDSKLRMPGCPGLYPETWRMVLESEGFRSVIFPAQEIHPFGQQIVVAESDGVVRQKQLQADARTLRMRKFEFSSSRTRAMETPVTPKPPVTQLAGMTTEILREKSTSYFKKLMGEMLKIPYQKINSAESYEKYGVDSILVVQLTNTLSKVLDNINSTLFFEYQTIDELVAHFLKTQKEALLKLVRLENQHDETILVNDKLPASRTRAMETSVTPKPPVTQLAGMTTEILREKSTLYFKKLMGEMLKIPYQKINSAEPYEKYGFDSILVVQLTNTLSKVLDDVTSTLFFEYQTIDELVDHFLKTQQKALIKLAGLENQHDETILVDDKLPALTPSVPSMPAFRGLRRFLQFSAPEITKSKIQSSLAQDVAVIGLAGRYPGAENIQEFWNCLKEGKNCITEIPEDRFDWKEYFDEVKGKDGTLYTKWGGFIKDIDKFDPLFFHISPKEAEDMDPQERLFLEVAYSSIEDSGYTPATLCDSRKIGVFVGVMNGYYLPGPNFGSIANRISYLLNFNGPSMAVDTACSSSLTALHLALESIYSGLSECAIAGGVNLILSPVHYLRLSSTTMLTAGNQCKSFGDGADGIVDGEAVGAIVLKPLSKAIADGDRIYGIIKGSMLNAGGKTNGYTVPNPNAQRQLVAGSLKRAGIHARTISYLEAHGTGTALGDPIEITGLTRAFEEDTQDKQFCAIGSVKSNIGHCESAAGISGVTKVLLQMKYHQLAPSLHSSVLNANIDFPNTPFVVQQTLAEWERPVVTIDGVTKEYPRIAGISSFGAGGANAHVMIEEYISKEPGPELASTAPTAPTLERAIIVLSAKDEDRLKEQVGQLLAAIKERQFMTEESLADIAYTLQVGREAMEERLGVIAVSLKELVEKLQDFMEGRDGIDELYRGQVKQNQETLAVLATDEEMQETVDKWIQRKKYRRILELWVKGLEFDWNRLYGNNKPHRISLPTYPFAKERYWLSEEALKMYGHASYGHTTLPSLQVTATSAYTLHPLLQQNTSNFSEQRFSSTFTGKEIFFAEDDIQSQRILPGLACLEMVRVAVEAATGTETLNSTNAEFLAENRMGIRLKNIIWVRPIVVRDQPIQVHIGLFPEEGGFKEAVGEIACEVYGLATGKPDTKHDEIFVYNQSYATLVPVHEIPTLDLKVIKGQCNRNTISATEFYTKLKALGIECGLEYQGVETIYAGQGQVLAKLALPSVFSTTLDQFVLHPKIFESALQAAMGLMMEQGLLKSITPITLNGVEIFGKCTSPMWAFIRYSDGHILPERAGQTGNKPSPQTGLPKLDIDFCDEHGMVHARMKGLETQAL